MKLHRTHAENHNLITGYGEGYIEVNKQRFTQNVIVMPDEVHTEWSATKFNLLAEADFNHLIPLRPELVLLGTGDTHQFIHPKLTRALTEKGITVECMTTQAACRTYNILMSEGRNIAAALILPTITNNTNSID